MRIIVLHYHFRPGGVTDVVVGSLTALCEHRRDIRSIELLCGEQANAAETAARVRAAADGAGIPVGLTVAPELGYTDATEPTDRARERAAAIGELLRSRYAAPEDLLWVHNYHLGKNPSLTLALAALAAGSGSPRMLLHIHDFPEEARYESLAYLRRVAGHSPYPSAPRVHYALINERDRRFLVEAGVPERRVHLLLNPVAGRPPAAAPDGRAGAGRAARRLAEGLAAFAREEGFTFDPQGPLLLYPVRAIRRKNVLEIAGLSRLVEGANLVTTLPGTSEAEHAYSDLVRQAYTDGRIRGVFGVGSGGHRHGVSFDDLCRGCDAVVGSSVQEGFGLLFANALAWQKPLFARRLDVLEGVDALFEGYPARFYAEFLVPRRSPGIVSMDASLRLGYQERIGTVGPLLPPAVHVRLQGELEALLDGPTVGFSFLPPPMQLSILGALRDETFAAEVRALNEQAVHDLGALARSAAPDVSDRLEATLGYGAFAERFSAVLDAMEGGPEDQASGPRIIEGASDELVAAFVHLGHLRLLFDAAAGNHDR